ncbi:MAG: hypothetical protein RLZZ123_2111 [Pseudomonadota bacterium]|jgi:hypothetical protein
MTCAGIQWVITRHAKGKTLRFKKASFISSLKLKNRPVSVHRLVEWLTFRLMPLLPVLILKKLHKDLTKLSIIENIYVMLIVENSLGSKNKTS